MSGWDAFNKYIGVQGVIGFILVGGYVYAAVTQTPLPDAYGQIMTLVLGYYFAKNGVGAIEQIITALRKPSDKTPKGR